MTSAELIHAAYAAFNARDIDAALALMTGDVHWPKASEGGTVVGKAAIRDYWTRQWAEFNPTVEPTAIQPTSPNQLTVRVHQQVKDLAGNILFQGEVLHHYTLRDYLIAAMHLDEQNPEAFHPSSKV